MYRHDYIIHAFVMCNAFMRIMFKFIKVYKKGTQLGSRFKNISVKDKLSLILSSLIVGLVR